jgi:TolB-like protein
MDPTGNEEPGKSKTIIKPPDWVLGKEHPDFPKNQYLVGVGLSDMHSGSAKDSARSNLAKNLKVKVRSKFSEKGKKTVNGMDGDISATESTQIELVIETEVDAVLKGVEIKDGWLDQSKGVFYAFAVVERTMAASWIQDEISKIESILKRNLNEGIKAEKRGDVITALSSYLSGYKNAPSIPPLKNAVYIITNVENKTESQDISTQEFESRVKRIAKNLNIDKVSGDRQIVKTQIGVTEPLVAKVFLLTQEDETPVSNIPVTFKYQKGKGELEKEKTSGSDGTMQTTVHKIASYKEANHIIIVQLDYASILSKIDGGFAEKILSPLKTKSATFNYTIQTPKWSSSKSQAWKESIIVLINQIISNIPPGKEPVLGVIPFKNLRYNRVTPFSRILNEDIKTILAQAQDLKLNEIKIEVDKQSGEIAEVNKLDYYVTGSYRMEKAGLEIRSLLINTQTQNILSSANIIIDRKELNSDDIALIDTMSEDFKSAQIKKSYQEHLEKLVAEKPHKSSFNVYTWTDKKDYEIDEKIVFYVKSDKNGYLTMLDVGPNGDITVIFPNKFHRDNLIRAGVTYQVPSPNYGFEFDVRGPAGLERIKAIVTLNNISLLKLDLDKGFHSFKKESKRGIKVIQGLTEEVESVHISDWGQAYSEIFIFNKGEVYTRGSRRIRTAE